MNIKQMSMSTKTSNISITDPTVFHIIPEFGSTIPQLIYNSGITLNNCMGIVVNPNIVKLGNKTFNGKKLYSDAKNILMKNEKDHKHINVLQTTPSNISKQLESNKFLIIDQSIISQATEHIINITSIKNGTIFLLQQLKKEFSLLKTKIPQANHNIIFLLNSNKPSQSIVETLKYISLNPNVHDLKIFDDFAIINITSSTPTIFPIMGFINGEVQIHKSNILAIDKIYDKMKDEVENPPTVNDKVEKNITKLSNSEKEEYQKINVKVDSDITRIYNEELLSKTLKKYKIVDKTVGDNIRLSINNYIKHNNNEVTQSNIEYTILKAINKTIFNTDEIEPEYLNNPNKLISKLQEINTYSKDINIPKTRQNFIVSPKDVISLKKVTGTIRHEYEFGTDQIHENIEQSFKLLEDKVNNPIKIKKIKHTYEDDNLNRYINYEVTLQNLTGENKNPYTVNVKIPALVNDRYFKLRGKNYILSNQQFFKPLTKTEPNKCRFLSSYAMITMSIVNMKMNLSEIDKIVNYMNMHYPDSIIELENKENKILSGKFKDKYNNKYELNLYNDEAYISKDEKLFRDEETKKWLLYKESDNSKQLLSIGKNEFFFSKLINIMQTYNPDENLRRSAKSIPYIQIHVTGVELPLILYMWQQIGLLNALKKFGINYELTASQPNHSAVSLSLDKKTLHMYPSNDRERLIVNGLLIIDNKKINLKETDINNTDKIGEYLNDKNGSRSVYNLNLTTSNMIDPITKDLLENSDKPTNIIDLLSTEMVDILLNNPADSLTDLKLYRSRQAEIMFNLLYTELAMAHSRYNNTIKFDKNAKLYLQEDYIIQCLLGVHQHSRGDTVVELCDTYSPVAELKTATKMIKTG